MKMKTASEIGGIFVTITAFLIVVAVCLDAILQTGKIIMQLSASCFY